MWEETPVEWLVPVLAALAELGFLGLLVWAVVLGVGWRRREDERVDTATSVRRLFEYGLMFTALMLTTTGAVMTCQELTAAMQDEADRSALALGLALVIVAGPAYTLLLLHSRRRLQEDEGERASFSWTGYLNLSLVVPLIVTTVTTQQMLEGVTGVEDFEVTSVVPVVAWGAVWAAHWFWLKAAFGAPNDWHLTAGSLTGLVTLALGAGGLAFGAGDAIYTTVVDRVPTGHGAPDLRTWAIAASIGAAVWSWHWLGTYQRAERTSLWHTYVVLVGSLGGLVAAVASAATIIFQTLVWFAGSPSARLASEHFEYVPAAPAAILIVGAVSWQYHCGVLQRHDDIERTEPLRAHDYLVAGAGLVASVVGVTVALAALLEAVTPEPPGTEPDIANRVILAATLTVIGGALWWVFWSRIRWHVTIDPEAELASMVRRIYLLVLFGLGGIVVLVSLIVVLFIGLEDLLDGTFGGETVRSFRVALSLVAVLTGLAWYHLGVFRSDRAALIRMAPSAPAHAPSARHVILVSPRGAALADELAAETGADLETWYRTDDTSAPETDLKELAARIEAEDACNVLVVVGPGRPTVIPLDPSLAHGTGGRTVQERQGQRPMSHHTSA